jgi:hypothetical protein
VKGDTRWWSLAELFNTVDMGAINAYALNTTSFPSRKKERASRHFLIDHAGEMVESEIIERLENAQKTTKATRNAANVRGFQHILAKNVAKLKKTT